MKTSVKRYAARALLTAIIAGIFAGAFHFYQSYKADKLYERQIEIIAQASGIDAVNDHHAKFDRLRTFIHINSAQRQDAEFFASWRDRTKIAANFIDSMQKKRPDRAPMECATRRGLMSAVLQSRGYRTRDVDLFRVDKDKNMFGHAALGVWNPATNAWETQDPEYDVYWKDMATGKRSSILHAINAQSKVLPCRNEICGMMLMNNEGARTSFLKEYTAFVTIIERAADERITFYRGDLNPFMTIGYNNERAAYCELIEKNCEDGILPAMSTYLRIATD